MSLLKKLPCSTGHGKSNVCMKNIHLHWVCRNIQDFLAFLPRLHLINVELMKDHLHSPLTVNLYLTGNVSVQPHYPPFTFNIGRPNFDTIFGKLCDSESKIKVLFCGSKSMNDSLYSKCKEFNIKKKNVFVFQKGEIFN
jgi:hypothetical protein